MKKHLFLFAAMACLGITTEIFFTAISEQIKAWPNPENWRLMGQSYIWMFPIYGIAGIAFPFIYQYISKIPFVFRTLIYAIGILAVEFITGWILDVFTGQCPWEYTSGWHVMGYIRIDYLPLWMAFGGFVEKVVMFLKNLYESRN